MERIKYVVNYVKINFKYSISNLITFQSPGSHVLPLQFEHTNECCNTERTDPKRKIKERISGGRLLQSMVSVLYNQHEPRASSFMVGLWAEISNGRETCWFYVWFFSWKWFSRSSREEATRCLAVVKEVKDLALVVPRDTVKFFVTTSKVSLSLLWSVLLEGN